MSHVLIRFYVGHVSKTASAKSVARAIKNLREANAGLWGGSTAVEGEGMFDGKAGFYREACTIVETVADTGGEPRMPGRSNDEWARNCARWHAQLCARAAGQECVMVTFQPIDVEFVSAE
jgi:hypothetical protein